MQSTSETRRAVDARGRAGPAAGALKRRIEALERENEQLQHALESRIVIEQAKGVLAERYRLDLGRSFELLRRAARSSRRRLHDVAAEVAARSDLPAEIELLAPVFASLDGQAGRPAGERRFAP